MLGAAGCDLAAGVEAKAALLYVQRRGGGNLLSLRGHVTLKRGEAGRTIALAAISRDIDVAGAGDAVARARASALGAAIGRRDGIARLSAGTDLPRHNSDIGDLVLDHLDGGIHLMGTADVGIKLLVRVDERVEELVNGIGTKTILKQLLPSHGDSVKDGFDAGVAMVERVEQLVDRRRGALDLGVGVLDRGGIAEKGVDVLFAAGRSDSLLQLINLVSRVAELLVKLDQTGDLVLSRAPDGVIDLLEHAEVA